LRFWRKAAIQANKKAKYGRLAAGNLRVAAGFL
jgi:hypothetical protein